MAALTLLPTQVDARLFSRGVAGIEGSTGLDVCSAARLLGVVTPAAGGIRVSC